MRSSIRWTSPTGGSPTRPTGGSSCTLPNSFSHRSSRPGFGCCWRELSRSQHWSPAHFLLYGWCSSAQSMRSPESQRVCLRVMRTASRARIGKVWSRRLISFWNDSRLAGGGFSVLGNLGHFSWVVVSIAATVALYRTGVSRVVVGATFLSVLFATHSGLGAAVGLIALFVAELLTFGRRSSGTAPSRAAGTGLETSDAHTA
jgi:hypothetical protein